MRTFFNIVWLITSGLWLALGYLFAGVIACLFIVTIPFGIASFRMASYALWPFGRTVVPNQNAGAASTVMNVIWFLVAGWWLALGHVSTAVASAATLIGIPAAIANIKMIPVTVVPFGKDIVSVDDLNAAYTQAHQFGHNAGGSTSAP